MINLDSNRQGIITLIAGEFQANNKGVGYGSKSVCDRSV
jgi:hypothetical protein